MRRLLIVGMILSAKLAFGNDPDSIRIQCLNASNQPVEGVKAIGFGMLAAMAGAEADLSPAAVEEGGGWLRFSCADAGEKGLLAALTHPEYGLLLMPLFVYPNPEWVVHLPARAALRGTVVDAQGNAVVGATVRLRFVRQQSEEIMEMPYVLPFAEGLPTAVTGADGTFSLEGLNPAFSVLLSVSHARLGETLYGQYEEMPFGVKERLQPGGAPVTVTMYAGGTVTGKVVSGSDRKPLGGIEVAAIGELMLSARKTVSGADGAFRIEALGPGEYALKVNTPGRFASDSVFNIGSADTLALPEISVDGGVRVAGRVFDEASGAPAGPEDVAISMEVEGDFASNRAAPVSDSGAFDFRLAAPNLITLNVTGKTCDIVEGYETIRLALIPGRDLERVEIKTKGYGALRGRVIDDSGAAAADFAIVDALENKEVARTGPDGAFSYAYPKQGPWGDRMNKKILEARGGTPEKRGAVYIEFISPEEVSPEIPVFPAASVTGRLLAPDGTAASGTRVRCTYYLSNLGTEAGNATTDASGMFRLEGLMARLKCSVRWENRDSSVNARRRRPAINGTGDLTLEPGETRDLGDLRMSAPSDSPIR